VNTLAIADSFLFSEGEFQGNPKGRGKAQRLPDDRNNSGLNDATYSITESMSAVISRCLSGVMRALRASRLIAETAPDPLNRFNRQLARCGGNRPWGSRLAALSI